jgi:hypothetical protein
MTVQEWLQENRYAESIPRRIAALLLKAVIELTVIAVCSMFLSFVVVYFVRLTSFEVSIFPETWSAVFGLFFAGGVNLGWCFTSDNQ